MLNINRENTLILDCFVFCSFYEIKKLTINLYTIKNTEYKYLSKEYFFQFKTKYYQAK